VKELKREKVRVKGKDVDVITMDVEHPELPIVRVMAEFEGRSLSATMTIGASDGPPVNLTAQKLQEQVDALRQQVAETLAGRAEAREFISNLS